MAEAQLYSQKWVEISYKGISKRFGIREGILDQSTFKNLVLDEFEINSWSCRTSLVASGDAAVYLPFELSLLEHEHQYELKVYPVKNANHPPPFDRDDDADAPPKKRARLSEDVPTTVPALPFKSECPTYLPSAPSRHSHSFDLPFGQDCPKHPSRMANGSEETVIGVYAYNSTQPSELNVRPGDVIRVTDRANNAWWFGESKGIEGFFPTNFVRLSHHEITVADFLSNPHANPTKPRYELNSAAMTSELCDYQDDWYFGGYNNLTIHHMMLSDNHRTATYQRAISKLEPLIKGKTILDVGCGTGILGIYCAKAGAEHVYGIDAAGIIHQAKEVVAENGLSSKVTLIQGKVEHETLPVDKVDIIVSEWMGSMLVVESMIHSVIHARDKYLQPDGVMLPSRAELYIAPIDWSQNIEEKVDFFDDVCGIKMSTLKPVAETEFFTLPQVIKCVKPEEVLADAASILEIDMLSVTVDELETIQKSFEFEVKKDGRMSGFAGWFDVKFDNEEDEKALEVLSTSPSNEETHWKQVVFILAERPEVTAGTKIKGGITMWRNQYWKRHFQVHLEYQLVKNNSDTGKQKVYRRNFALWK